MNWNDLIVRDSTDIGTLRDVIKGQYHVPRLPFKRDPELIVDLGCHAGYTMLHYAELYPKAYIVGFDLSRDNVVTAQQNVELAGLSDRIVVHNAAVAAKPGSCRPTPGKSNQHQIHLDSMGDVPVITMREVFLVVDGDPDFVKFDIEGAERGIFAQAGWSRYVKHIKAELHWDYTADEAVKDLQKLGFVAVIDGSHPACVEAWR